MSGRRVVLVGDLMMDVVVQPTAPLAPTSDTPANVRVGRGGAGANMAVGLARAGHAVTYLGAVGGDATGQLVVEELRNAGITVAAQMVDVATGVVVAVVAPDGQRAMLTSRGANQLLERTWVVEQLSAEFDHLHVSGYTLLDPATRDVARAALEIARARSVSASVDVCSVAPLATMTASVFLDAAAGASMLFANEEEAMVLASEEDPDRALVTLATLFDEVVVTRGARGAAAMHAGGSWRVAAQVTNVVDTTGAGDAATGAYLAARLNGWDELAALEDAMAAAVGVVRALGWLG